MATLFLSIVGALWLLGWASGVYSTDALQKPTLIKKIGAVLALAVLWPLIAIAQMRQGDR